MAPNASIVSCEENHLILRETTRDFLLKAQHRITPSGCNAISNYYRLRINSLLDPDHDDIETISKVAERDTRCVRCGNRRWPVYKDVRRKNQSVGRKHCRYLRANLVEKCHKCKRNSKRRLHRSQSIGTSKSELSVTRKQSKASDLQVAHPMVTSNLKQAKPVSQQSTQLRTAAKKIIKKGSQRSSLHQPSKQAAQFSNRLRAFSCLLEK